MIKLKDLEQEILKKIREYYSLKLSNKKQFMEIENFFDNKEKLRIKNIFKLKEEKNEF